MGNLSLTPSPAQTMHTVEAPESSLLQTRYSAMHDWTNRGHPFTTPSFEAWWSTRNKQEAFFRVLWRMMIYSFTLPTGG